MKKKISCDVAEASEAMRQRYERFEALACYIGKGIKDGIAEHNKHESGLGCLPAMPEEISQSLAEAVAANVLQSDRTAVERFIEDLHLSMSNDGNDRTCTL